jgi:hypothetical protein
MDANERRYYDIKILTVNLKNFKSGGFDVDVKDDLLRYICTDNRYYHNGSVGRLDFLRKIGHIWQYKFSSDSCVASYQFDDRIRKLSLASFKQLKK